MTDTNLLLKKKLQEIEQALKSNANKEPKTGVLSGLSGISLFYFYLAKYFNEEKFKLQGEKFLELALDKINDGNILTTYCNGLAGFGWVLDFLESKNFIDVESDKILSEFDALLKSTMEFELKKGNFDFLHGGIGYAYYFLSRYKNTKSDQLKVYYKTIIDEFINQLMLISSKPNNIMLRWESKVGRGQRENGIYDLGLAHGISSIISILAKLHELDEFKDQTKNILIYAVNYLNNCEGGNRNDISLFPNHILVGKETKYNSRLAWCYGDLGIGVSLWHASKTLKNKDFERNSLRILEKTVSRKKKENTLILDAGICHGSFGAASIYNRLFRETGAITFKQAANFWILDGLNKAYHPDGYAGYKQWSLEENKDKWVSVISLLNGITGIGLSIIDYLADFDENWDECLMIS